MATSENSNIQSDSNDFRTVYFYDDGNITLNSGARYSVRRRAFVSFCCLQVSSKLLERFISSMHLAVRQALYVSLVSLARGLHSTKTNCARHVRASHAIDQTSISSWTITTSIKQARNTTTLVLGKSQANV
jgi:hypothetical protein